jgi:hypothetical protein
MGVRGPPPLDLQEAATGRYLNEWTWRYNHREDPRAMFLTLIERAASIRVCQAMLGATTATR